MIYKNKKILRNDNETIGIYAELNSGFTYSYLSLYKNIGMLSISDNRSDECISVAMMSNIEVSSLKEIENIVEQTISVYCHYDISLSFNSIDEFKKCCYLSM